MSRVLLDVRVGNRGLSQGPASPAQPQLIPIVVALLVAAWPLAGVAQDELFTDDEIVVRTEGAHHLLLPKDWPVQQRDGHLAPVSTEEYLRMKLGQVREKFSRSDERLEAVEQRLQQLEGDAETVSLRLKRLEGLIQGPDDPAPERGDAHRSHEP